MSQDDQLVIQAPFQEEDASSFEAPVKPHAPKDNNNDMEDHTALTEDYSDSSSSNSQSLSKLMLGQDSVTSLQHHQQPLQRVDEDEESSNDSDLSLGEYKFEISEPSSSSNSQSLNASFPALSLHSKISGHSRNSVTSTGSLKVFRKGISADSWKNSGHDSLSFLPAFDDLEETENAADEDDLKVLCSRNSKRLKLLGEGAFGQVWLVRHNHKSYALKVCAKYDLLTEGAVHEVVREREIMSQLEHPCIARIWATNQDADFVYILEDYLAGGELYSVLERQDGKIAASQAQFYTACLADTLAYLHKQHIVYRDLKPENIIMSKHGFPTLIDFGCAKQLSAQDGFQTRTLCGTPRFASPEMILGEGHGFGTDHWALGILLYEMLAGENPFWYDEMSDYDLYEQVPSVEPSWKPLENVAPKAAIDLVQRLLIKDPAERLGAESEDQILQHEWLAEINVQSTVKAPWVPELTDPTDTQYFDDWEDQVEDRFAQKYPVLTPKEEAHFADF